MDRAERVKKLSRLAAHQLELAALSIDNAWFRLRRRGQGLDIEAAHWSRPSVHAMLTWQEHPLVGERINGRVSGDPGVNWLEFFHRDYGKGRVGRALNLGCGRGDLEAHALSIGLARSFLSIDISRPAVEAARERLQGAPVQFEVGDVNRMSFKQGAFDAVFAASSLHHFTDLERVLARAREALVPGGFLVFDEFVGPSRFQWTDEQLAVINLLLTALPARFRRDLRRGFGKKRRVYRAPLDDTRRDSPFEAARSEEIPGLAAERFNVVARKDYGGAILHQLLDGIAGNFSPRDSADRGLLIKIMDLERDLEGAGAIGSDFTVMVARKD